MVDKKALSHHTAELIAAPTLSSAKIPRRRDKKDIRQYDYGRQTRKIMDDNGIKPYVRRERNTPAPSTRDVSGGPTRGLIEGWLNSVVAP